MLEFSGESRPAMNLLFLVIGVLVFTPFTEHFFYFKVDILTQIGCIESLSQSPPSSSSPSPSSIYKVNFKLECERK